MKTIGLSAFAIVALVQWLIPGKMIWDREEILHKGTAFKFETAPIDPVNPFKGRYMVLNFKENEFRTPSAVNLAYGQEIYVLLEKDKSGYAKIKGMNTTAPLKQNDYVKVTVAYASKDDSSNITTVHIRYPFEEYYMDEFRAPKAETEYGKNRMDSTRNVYALIKIFKGNGVIQELYVGDVPLKDLIK